MLLQFGIVTQLLGPDSVKNGFACWFEYFLKYFFKLK